MRTFNEYNALHDKSAPVFNKMHKKVIFAPVMTRCLSSSTNYLLHDTCRHANCTICLHLWQKSNNHLQLVFHFICIIVLFDAFNKTQSDGEVAENIFSRLMKYFCVVVFRVDRPDPAQFQKINFVG